MTLVFSSCFKAHSLPKMVMGGSDIIISQKKGRSCRKVVCSLYLLHLSVCVCVCVCEGEEKGSKNMAWEFHFFLIWETIESEGHSGLMVSFWNKGKKEKIL